MMTSNRELWIGSGLLAGFAGVLVLVFLPIFNGENGFHIMDDLYNSISKASANHLPQLNDQARAFHGRNVSMTLELADAAQAEETSSLLAPAGAAVSSSGSQVKVEGDLGRILANCLADTTDMFENSGDKVLGKYGYPERRVLYNWWSALKAMEKQLNKQKMFREAKFVAEVTKKGVECSYNYYGIDPQQISDRLGIVVFSLVFYVLYTVWYGFAILYLFQGLGLKLEHG